jgi:hypothetical protein
MSRKRPAVIFSAPASPSWGFFIWQGACRPQHARVARSIDLRSQPDPLSPVIRKLQRDEILTLEEEILSPAGPQENPRWYRIAGGYVHSAHLQRVDQASPSEAISSVPEGGWLAEVSVPYTQTLYQNRLEAWVPLYRLYISHCHG